MEVEKEYASKGVAGAGLGLGIAGTALALMNGGLGGLGWGGNNAVAATAGAAGLSALAEKDAEIARLRSEKYSDNKTQELYNYIVAGNDKLTTELVNTRVRLATAETNIANMQNTLAALTVVRIPNSVLCPGVPAVEVVHTSTTSSTTTA